MGNLCCYAYITKFDLKSNNKIWYIALTASSIFLCCIDWNPQWFMLISPFLVLTIISNSSRKRFFAIDVIMSVSYFMIVWLQWDFFNNNLLVNGGLHNLFNSNMNIFPIYYVFNSSELVYFDSILIAIMIFNLIVRNPWSKKQIDLDYIDEKIDNNDKIILYARFIIPLIFYALPIIYWSIT
jgi:hypothetical protein